MDPPSTTAAAPSEPTYQHKPDTSVAALAHPSFQRVSDISRILSAKRSEIQSLLDRLSSLSLTAMTLKKFQNPTHPEVYASYERERVWVEIEIEKLISFIENREEFFSMSMKG